MIFNLQKIIYAGVLGILLQPLSTFAYKEDTHMQISRASASSSNLTKIELLNDLGLTFPIEDDKQQFPDSDGIPRSIINLIRQGANFEDKDSRALNHFFNPLTNQPLTIFGFSILNATSPDWALEDKGDIANNIGGAQDFSYKDARQSFYKALTAPAKIDRDKNFGLTFQTLGQVIHHIQDMAQPQHVRNDAHLDKYSVEILGLQLNPLYNPSRYESDTNFDLAKLTPLFDLYPPVNSASDTNLLTTPRSFWHTAQGGGMGLAEFTNRNFVSAGTNFDTTRYPSPSLAQAVAHDEDAHALLQSVGLTPPPECPPTPAGEPLKCAMTFYRTTVNDTYRPSASRVNEKTSTSSIFDQNLAVKGLTPVSSLNRFNFDAAHEFLIPRAVGYSAGLINYFFRGKMEISLPDEGVYGIVDHNIAAGNTKDTGGFGKIKLKLKNVTPSGNGIEPMEEGIAALWAIAKFHRNICYQPDLSGEYGSPNKDWSACRAKDEEIVVSEAAIVPVGINNEAQGVTFTFTTPIPINATDLFLQVVYRGPLGQETDAVVVATKDISEPTYLYNYSRLDQYTYGLYPVMTRGPFTWEQWCLQGYPSQDICNRSSGLTHKVQFSATTDPIPGYDPSSSPLPPGQWHGDIANEPPLTPVATLVAPVGTLARVAVLLDASPVNTGLVVWEWIDATDNSSLFQWFTGTALASTSQRDAANDTLIPSVTYLPGRGVYLPAAENSLLIDGDAESIPNLMLVPSQINF